MIIATIIIFTNYSNYFKQIHLDDKYILNL